MSTKDILSEGELDALMNSVSSGDVPLEDAGGDQGCQLFDFSTREQALLAQMPALKTINEKHSIALVEDVQAFFKLPVEVDVSEIKLLKIGEVLAAVADPSAINVVRIAPLNGNALVILPGEMLSFFVEQYFGGAPGANTERADREDLTPTERRISDVLTEKFLLTLQDAWQEKVSLSAELLAFEVNPEFLPPLPTGDLALQFVYEFKVLDWQSSIHWVVPYAAIEALRVKLGDPLKNAPAPKVGSDWGGYFRKELQGVEVEVSGLFASRDASLGDVLGFQLGSIVPLKAPSDVTVCIEGQPFSQGEYGVLNGQKSIKIKRIYPPGGDA